MVKEDMKTAKQGNTFTSLQLRRTIYFLEIICEDLCSIFSGRREALDNGESERTTPAGQERVRGDGRVVPESVHGRGGESEGGEKVAGGQEEDQDVTDITTLSHIDQSKANVD